MRKNPKTLFNHVATNHTQMLKDTIALVPEGGNYKDLPEGWGESLMRLGRDIMEINPQKLLIQVTEIIFIMNRIVFQPLERMQDFNHFQMIISQVNHLVESKQNSVSLYQLFIKKMLLNILIFTTIDPIAPL